MADYDIAQAFAEVENELIDSMMRNFSRHRAEETEQGYNWTQWQAEQLKALEDYKKNNRNKFGKEFDSLNQKIRETIQEYRRKGNADQEYEILQAIKRGYKLPHGSNKPAFTGTKATAEFFKLNDRKLEALIKSTTNDLKKAETAVLRMSEDKYRKAIFNAQVYANTGAATYEKAVDMACRDMLRAGLNCVEYKNGARHTLSNYAEMAIRTANKRAYLRGEGERRQARGISTVVVNRRRGGCSHCAKYVGKVYIDDVYSGGKASDGDYPLLSEAIEDGLFHPNCKDSTSTYYEGITTLKPVSDDELKELDRRRKLEEHKNYYDNQAEKNQRIADYSLDSDNKRIYQQRAKASRKKAAEIENKLDVSVAKSENGDIIKSEHFLKNHYSIPFGKIIGEKPISKRLAKEYSDEFDKASAIFGKISTISSVEVKTYENNGIWGSFNDNSGVLVLFGAGGNDGVSVLSKIALEFKKRGEWSTSSYLHSFRHELGHAILRELSMNEHVYFERMERISQFRDEIFKEIAQHDHKEQSSMKSNLLSIYGLDDIGEIDDFIAESIAEYLKGKPRPTEKKL